MAKLVITQFNTSPALTDALTFSDGSYMNLSSCTVKFRMRALGSSVLKIDAAASITDAVNGEVEYDWVDADVDTAGEWRGWWNITLPSTKDQDSPEFVVIIDGHTDGEGVETGEIAYQARQIMPLTWDALSNDSRYGDRMLNTRVNYIKYKLFNTVVDPELEMATYNPFVVDYAAKCVALQIIPAAIEYWMNQQETVTTTGTFEMVTYPDRIRALKDLQDWLTAEVRAIEGELPPGTITPRKSGRGPKIANGYDLITPNPQTWPKQKHDHLREPIPWSPWV